MRPVRSTFVALATLIAVLVSFAGVLVAHASDSGAPAFAGYNVLKVGEKDGGGEPSIATDLTPSSPGYGNLYVSWPGDHVNMAVSSDDGATWTASPQPPNVDSVGDTSVNIDASGAVYQTNLNNLEPSDKTLQAEIWKSTDFGASWPQQGQGAVNPDNASNMPLFVDRQWAGSYVPPGKTTANADVYLSYHDFGPSQIWVNISHDGGKTFGAPVDVIASSFDAQGASFCNTIPGGLQVAQTGPHAGRVYVAWIAGDIATNLATGCNITQMDTFHSVWIAWSDDNGKTWTAQQAFDGGFGHDASALFADLTLDNQGEPYVAFGDNLKDEWDLYVMGAQVGLDKAAAPAWKGPFQVNTDTGTHYFPAIAVGDPGKVDVAYLRTETVIPTLPYGKPSPESNTTDKWYLYAAQTGDLFADGGATWSVEQLTRDPMHVGDICVLGIFCAVSGGNRDILDFIDASIDPTGLMHVAFTADVEGMTGIYVANQTSGDGAGVPPLEKTLLTVKANLHRAAATLVGSGGTPLAGKTVQLLVNRKLLFTVETDDRGRAVLRRAFRHGDTVRAIFQGDETYAASSAATTA